MHISLDSPEFAHITWVMFFAQYDHFIYTYAPGAALYYEYWKETNHYPKTPESVKLVPFDNKLEVVQ